MRNEMKKIKSTILNSNILLLSAYYCTPTINLIQ